MPTRRRRLLASGVASFLCAGLARPQKAEFTGGAGAKDVSEIQVKAAYLHKFAGFVEWPAENFSSPTTPFQVVVVGSDPVYAELSRIAPGRAVQGRPVEVSQVAVAAALPSDVHVVYLGSAPENAVTLERVRNKRVLTVADAPWGQRMRVVLSFIEDNGRIRFDASLKAAEQAGIKLSARLLGVARKVVETSQ